jgi:hypothetical protein
MGTRILAHYQKPDWLTKHLFNPGAQQRRSSCKVRRIVDSRPSMRDSRQHARERSLPGR